MLFIEDNCDADSFHNINKSNLASSLVPRDNIYNKHEHNCYANYFHNDISISNPIDKVST